MTNFRVLVIYQTKLIKRNRNFEPTLLSFFITQSSFASCMYTEFTKWNSFLDIFQGKVIIWKYSKSQINLWFDNFYLSCFLVCLLLFLFRLLNFVFQSFTSIENLPNMKNSLKNNGLNIKNNIEFYKLLHHNTQMSRRDAKNLHF